jgi:hypothetical protein
MNGAEQLSLPLSKDVFHLRDFFQSGTGKPVSLVVTDNSASVLSIREKGKTVVVRLHRMFLDAGDDVIAEITRFIRCRKGRTPLLRRFLKENSHRIKKPSPRRTTVRTAGKYHDLHEIFHSLNDEYFGGRISCTITWGATRRWRSGYAVRRRTLGSYSGSQNVIRINPVLDRRSVPRYFVEFVVYHEMLHADMGVNEKNGRRRVHSGEFKKRERLFRHYNRTVAWEKGKRF